MTKYKDKVVWITGASSGIGEALVYKYAKEEARLVISARREKELLRVKQACNLPDREVFVLPLDLNDGKSMNRLAAQVMNHFGRIDLVIHNGGISQRSLIKDTELEVYERMMQVNYLGTVALTKAVLPYYIRQKEGHFAVVTSLMGKFASPLRSGYCGAKHALHGFFDALRLEHEDDHIQVTILCPGFIKTNISKNALTADGSPQQTMDDATGAGMSADECANRMYKAIKRGDFERVIGGNERFGVFAKRLSNRLIHRIVKNKNVT